MAPPDRDRSTASAGPPRWFAAGLCLLLAALLWYYLWFLERQPAHRELANQLKLSWTLDTSSIAIGYLLVAVPAAVWLWRHYREVGAFGVLLLIFFAVTLLLSMHDRLISPVQPLHFTRGYSWMALCLLGLPQWQRWVSGIGRWRPAPRVAALALLFAVVGGDNLTFLVRHARQCYASLGPLALHPSERAVFRQMDARGLDGVLACPEPRACHLAAIYTGVRPYVGHTWMTPKYVGRSLESGGWYSRGAKPPPDAVDLVLVTTGKEPEWVRSTEWTRSVSAPAAALYERVRRPAAGRSE
jgi:hypothetical protein